MSEPNLGELNPNGERDAIHIAVVPLVAGEKLLVGQPFNLHDGKAVTGIGLGVVDPFLGIDAVKEGDKFWGYLNPGTVTGMRHLWEHPEFPNNYGDPEGVSRRWMEAMCDDYDVSIADVISNNVHIGSREYITDEFRYHPEFEKHYKAITGLDIEDVNGYWSCGC